MLKTGVLSRLTIDMIFSGLQSFPGPGEELQTTGFCISPGGGTIVSATRLYNLGSPVKLGVFVNKGQASMLALELLRGYGLPEYENLFFGDDEPITVSAVFPMKNDRSIVSYEKPVIDPKRNAELVRFYEGCDIALCIGEPDLLRELKATGKMTVLDPADFNIEKSRMCMPYTDVMTPNLREALHLTEATTPEEALRIMKQSGVALPIIKMGACGCMYYEAETPVTVPTASAEITDPTGAGDNFVAGLLYGLANRLSADTCVRLGNIFGSISVGATGAFGGDFSMKNICCNYEKTYGAWPL